VEPAGCSVVAIGMGSEYRMPPSFAGSWTYTSYGLVRTGTLMLYHLVLGVRPPVGTAWKVGMAGGAASPVAERLKSKSANCVWDSDGAVSLVDWPPKVSEMGVCVR